MEKFIKYLTSIIVSIILLGIGLILTGLLMLGIQSIFGQLLGG